MSKQSLLLTGFPIRTYLHIFLYTYIWFICLRIMPTEQHFDPRNKSTYTQNGRRLKSSSPTNNEWEVRWLGATSALGGFDIGRIRKTSVFFVFSLPSWVNRIYVFFSSKPLPCYHNFMSRENFLCPYPYFKLYTFKMCVFCLAYLVLRCRCRVSEKRGRKEWMHKKNACLICLFQWFSNSHERHNSR